MSDIAQRAKRPKREHGSGTMTWVDSHTCRLRAPGGKDKATGKNRQISLTIHTAKHRDRGGKGEAAAELRKLVAEVKAGKHVGTAANFSTLTAEYLAHVKRTLDYETYQGYRIKLENVIEPALGPIKLASLTAHDIDTLYGDLESRYAPSTIEFIHNVISGALTQAIKWGWIDKNPAKLATPPKVLAEPRAKLSPDQIHQLIQVALEVRKDEDIAVLIYLLCLVGGRRGEACGFQWGDVDWQRRVIRVERQIVPRRGGQVVKLPKGDKKRIEAIGEAGVRVLMGYQATLRKRLGENWKPDPKGWLISPDGGTTPLAAHGISDRIKLLGRACDPPIDARPHDCRRFSVSEMIEGGIDPLTIRDRHGHASITTTEGYMLRSTPSDMEAADFMGRVLMSSAALLVSENSEGAP